MNRCVLRAAVRGRAPGGTQRLIRKDARVAHAGDVHDHDADDVRHCADEPLLPSPLRFEVETYDQLHVITHPDPGYCFVDANNP
jgi:hypothetical protein